MKKMMVLCLLLLAFAVPSVWAEEKDLLDIQLQLNNDTVLINGVSTTVEPPYLNGDHTLVPLRVVTAAFGATLQWDGATQTIVLKYDNKQIKLVIDSTKAEVNGTPTELQAAPQLKNGTTMVPIRFISENFGAEVGYDAETSRIKISGVKKVTVSGLNTDIDSDLGKTLIGNSYFGWTMKYPSGLVMEDQNFRENYVYFRDAKDEFGLEVYIEEDQDRLTKENLLKKLASDVDETILERKYVEENGLSYAKVISRYDKEYTEHRAYQNDDHIYTVMLYVDDEANYKNVEKSKSYKDLLDSFTLSFDKNDSKIKDLSSVKDGFRTFTQIESGITLSIPADWIKTQDSDWLIFSKKDSSEALRIRVSSAIDGDTLDAWIKREFQYITDEYVKENLRLEMQNEMTVSGLPGKRLKYAVLMGKDWSTIYGLYLFKERYKIEIDVKFEKSSDNAVLVDKILNSITIKKGVTDTTLGIIYDDQDYIDRTKMTTMKYKKMGFSVDIPDYWTKESDDGDDEINFVAGAGTFKVHFFEDDGVERMKKIIDDLILNYVKNMTDFKLITSSQEHYAGVNAHKYIYMGKTGGGITYETKIFLIANKGNLYIVETNMYKATSTEKNMKMFETVLQSFKFME